MSQTNPKLTLIRNLLAKAEDDAATPAEAEAYRAKAYALMAAYGIERAMLADATPADDKPGDRIVDLDNPWSMEKARLYNGLAKPLRCSLILTNRKDGQPGRSAHLFGFGSDLERLDMLATSLMVQMFRELALAPVPHGAAPRAWRRSWMLGFIQSVAARVAEAEHRAAAEHTPAVDGRSVALVLADRSAIVQRTMREKYPRIRTGGTTRFSGSGYGDGQAAGRRADIGQSRVSGGHRAAINS